MKYIVCAFGVYAIVLVTIASACPLKCKDYSYKPGSKYCCDDYDCNDYCGGKPGPCYYEDYCDYDYDCDGKKCYKTFTVEKEVPCPKFSKYDNYYDDGYCKCKYDDDIYSPYGPCGKPKPPCKKPCKPDCDDKPTCCKKPCPDKTPKCDKCCKYNYDKCCKPTDCKPKPCKPDCKPSVTILFTDTDECDTPSCVKPCPVKKPCCVVEEDSCYQSCPKPYYQYYYPYYNYKYPSCSYPTCESYC